jgi:pimeloyl-ACP methyl ester carboxylesterase
VTSPLRVLDWWVRDYLYAAYWQCRAVLARTKPDAFLSGAGTVIVVVPGVYETWRFLQPLIEELHGRGHPVHVIEVLRWNTLPVAGAAEAVNEYLRTNDLHDVVIVAHSKGGLIGKYVMALGSEARRVRAMLAVATPFGGSRYASFMLAPTLRIFRPSDATIVALGADEAINANIVSIFGEFDPHVPGGSALVGAKNVPLDTGGHFRILANPRVIAELAVLAE